MAQSFAITGTNGFVSKLRYEGARPNLFELSGILKGDAAFGGSNVFKYMCKTASIPAGNLGMATVNYFGRPVKYPGNRTFDDLSTTIIGDEGYAIRNQIENWMAAINSHQSNVRDDNYYFKSNYAIDLTLKQYGKNGDVLHTWKFVNCFPTSLDEVGLGWDTNDSILEFSVNWAYDYWEWDSVTNSSRTPDDIP